MCATNVIFENFSENSLKGDLSKDTTDNLPLFSLVNTFKIIRLMLSMHLKYKAHSKHTLKIIMSMLSTLQMKGW